MKRLFITASTLASSLFLAMPAFAQTAVNPCPNDPGGGNYSGLCSLNFTDTLPRIITIAIVVAIVLALAFLIWGGIRWILSAGDKHKVEAARGTIIAAIVGLIIIFLAWFILGIVVRFFTGGDLKDLTLPTVTGAGGGAPSPDCSQPGSTC